MSRTWDLRLDCRVPGGLAAEARFSETHDGLYIEHEITGVAETMMEIGEDGARLLRDWLSWYLGDGPEPGDLR